ncbi:MAG: hypothetical protein WAM66_04880 [Acidobacteriaceae bacterium]
MLLLRRLSPLLLASLLWCAPNPASAQTTQPDNSLIPRSMESLGRYASFHTDFTFDTPMLRQLACGLPNDENTQRILENLHSVTVYVFHYPRPGLYAPADLDGVRAYYRASGWKHLIAAQPNSIAAAGRTDLWVRFDHDRIEAMTLLVAEPKALNLVEVDGTLSPLDLLRLRGHFGIPRFSGDHFIGENGQRFLPGDR